MVGPTAAASMMVPAPSDERDPTLHHAPIQSDDERKWSPVRSHRVTAPRSVLADVVRLGSRALPGNAGETARPAVPKDKRRPAMY